ncbi:hypothetical protein Q5752_001932 [Cryptotrichosporon argae]
MSLTDSLERHNAAFTTLLSLIPPKYYIAPTAEEADSKWMKNKKRRTGEEIKEHKRKARQDKLDPENHRTTDEILALSGFAAAAPAASSSAAAAATGPAPIPGLPRALPPAIQPLPPSASITDLRARMRSKLDGMRAARGADDDDAEVASRDALEAARRARRGEVRDKRRAKRKEERAEERKKAAESARPAKTQLIVPETKAADTLLFPSLALPSSSSRASSGGPLKKLSNPSQALAHLEKHNAKLAALPEDKRREAEERERWAKAEARAAGTKVADEERTLKKAVKREEKRKAKSGAAWADRKKELERSQAAKIKKRSDNIASRLDAKRNKRLGIKDKGAKDKGAKGGKGKGRPGFEGKRKERK